MNTMKAKKKIVTKVRETLVLSAADRKAWIKSYEDTGRLPDINIPCSRCNLGITAAHGNLRAKVAKYKGIANLLETFVCKTCTQSSKMPRAIKPTRSPRKRKSREVAPGVTRDADGRYDIPAINLNAERRAYSIQEIALSAEMTQDLTRGACLQPHVYLDNDSTCDHCPLFEHCACTGKRLSRAAARASAAR
jgi:hypothetical protein